MATYIAWKDNYSVNDPSMDAEHKQIITCINGLYSAIQSPTAGFTTKRVLEKLVHDTRAHFAHEEARLREVGFPDFEAHKALHDNMKQQTFGLRTHLTLATARDTLTSLKDWWIGHIQGEDKVYASYLPSPVAR